MKGQVKKRADIGSQYTDLPEKRLGVRQTPGMIQLEHHVLNNGNKVSHFLNASTARHPSKPFTHISTRHLPNYFGR